TGRKMSKHLGNVLEPIPLMDRHGADALRWFFAASGSPWGARRVGHDVLSEIVRKVLLTYWNTASFLVLYANAGGWSPSDGVRFADRPLLDRWVLSELHSVVRDVTAALEAFDTAAAGRRLTAFIDDLSNWYVRRSRRRFWDGPSTSDGGAALTTLYGCGAPGRRSRCIWPRGLLPRSGWSIGSCRSRWRWPGGWSSWDVRPGRGLR